jgi:hypothetical protein
MVEIDPLEQTMQYRRTRSALRPIGVALVKPAISRKSPDGRSMPSFPEVAVCAESD